MSDDLFEFVRKFRPFGLKPLSSRDRVRDLLKFAKRRSGLKKGTTLFDLGDPSDTCFMVVTGSVNLVYRGIPVYTFKSGETFGEIGMLEGNIRRGSAVVAEENTSLLSLSRDSLQSDSFPPDLLREVYSYLGKRVARLLLADEFYRSNMDVLIVQDGGCAPGYNAVTSFLTEKFEKKGRRVFVALEGFKSLASDTDKDFGLLVVNPELRQLLSNVPRVYDAAALKHQRGAAFRTERFPQFKQDDVQERAVSGILRRGVRVIVCIGGNGTMKGAKALAKRLKDKDVKIFFIPVTIDSDIMNTETIGQHTGVERGSEKLKSYCADAYTHQRCYIKEMMGADGGFHALHSCVGAGAHYAALREPLDKKELERIAVAVSKRRSTVIAVAEGYARALRRGLMKADLKGVSYVGTTSGRPGQKDLMSAATFLHYQLKSTGKLDPKKKVVCESFARDLRGAAANNCDIFLSQQMASKVVEMTFKGMTNRMPAVNSGVVSSLSFDELKTWNGVSEATAALADRL